MSYGYCGTKQGGQRLLLMGVVGTDTMRPHRYCLRSLRGHSGSDTPYQEFKDRLRSWWLRQLCGIQGGISDAEWGLLLTKTDGRQRRETIGGRTFASPRHCWHSDSIPQGSLANLACARFSIRSWRKHRVCFHGAHSLVLKTGLKSYTR